MSVHAITRNDGKRAYKVRWREGGSNRSRQFDRKQDALDWESRVRRERQTGELAVLTGGTQTLDEYADRWWTDYAEPNLTAGTRAVYATQLDLRIAPQLGGYKLRELTPALVQAFLASSPAGSGGCLDRQDSHRPAVDAPARLHRRPDRPQPRRGRSEALPAPQAGAPDGHTGHGRAIRRQLKQRRCRARLGARIRRPAPGVRGHHVDVVSGGKRALIDASKTGRQRNVRILDPLASDLAEWRKALGSGGTCSLEGGRPGTHDDWRNWTRRIYRPAAIKAGLGKDTRPRDLRGSFASLLIYEGRNVVEVADQLGHSPQTCLRDYAGVFAEFTSRSGWVPSRRSVTFEGRPQTLFPQLPRGH